MLTTVGKLGNYSPSSTNSGRTPRRIGLAAAGGTDILTVMERTGEYPYTRGVHSGGYQSKLWTMRQYAGFGDARETNQRYRYLLAQGQTGLSMAFDLPTQIGYDSDDAMALGEVGRVGVAISSIADMEQVFAKIPLDKVSTSMIVVRPA